MHFENTIFKTIVKRLYGIDLKLLFLVKIIKKDLIMLLRISIIFNALNVKNYFNINKFIEKNTFLLKKCSLSIIYILNNTLKKKKKKLTN